MAVFSKVADKASKVNYGGGNVLYWFAWGTIIVSGVEMHLKFFNGVEQRFQYDQFTTVEPDLESLIDSLIALDYFRVPTTGSGGGGGGGDASAANQSTQITLATSLNGLVSTAANQVLTNTKLDTLIVNNATSANQVSSNAKLDSIISALALQSTAANQVTGNVSLASIDTKLTDNATETKQDDNITALGNLLTELQLKADLTETQPVSLASLPLATGASTEAKQDTGNTSLTSIDSKTPSDPATVTKQDEIIAAISGGGATALPAQPDRDAFGNLRTSQSVALIDLKQVVDNLPLFFDRETFGGSSQVWDTNTSSTNMFVGGTSGNYAIAQTFQRLHYQAGKSQLIKITFRLLIPMTDIIKRVGYFSSAETGAFDTVFDGIYLESSNGTVKAVIANNGTLTTVEQVNWNLDTFDGTGDSGNPSGILINWNRRQIAVTDFQWLSVGRVRMGLSINGLLYYFHEFNHANNSNIGAYMRSPHKPIRYEIRSTGGSASLIQICASVESEGGQQPLGVQRTIRDARDLQCNTANTDYAIYGLRLKAGVYSEIILESINIINQNNDDFFYSIVLNPTVTGTFAYTDVTNSSIQKATSLVGSPATITGGTELFSGVSQAASNVEQSINNAIKLGTSIDGTKDEIVLIFNGITNGADVYATLNWRELS